MKHWLNTYCCREFDGRIYVWIKSRSIFSTISFTLIKDGKIAASVSTAHKFFMFEGQDVGVYKAIADLTFADDSVATIVSPLIHAEWHDLQWQQTYLKLVKGASATGGKQRAMAAPVGKKTGRYGGTARGAENFVQSLMAVNVLARPAELPGPAVFRERIFRIATAAQFVLLDAAIGYIHQQLLHFDIIEISAQNGVWRDQIVFPEAAQFPQGRVISFDSRAQWNISLVVNGRCLLMTEGSSARYVAYLGRWQQIL